MSILKLNKFSLRVNDTLLLKHVSLQLDYKDFVAITSDQQGGKSSFLSAIAGFSSTGCVSYTGEVCYKNKILEGHYKSRGALHHEIIFIGEHSQLISRMNLRDNILLPFAYHGEKCDMKKLHSLIAQFNLEQNTLDLMPEQVNDVTTSICLIIRSLLLNPSLLLLDEMEGGMNKTEHINTLNIIKKYCLKIKCAVLSTTTRIEGDMYTQAFDIKDKHLAKISL